jgi:predicted DNA-binding protein (UPF0251 family)
MTQLEEIVLTVDEFEAIRLADLRGLYHEDAAKKMGISRQTFGRIIGTARKKVAEALVKGKSLKIQGGDFKMTARRKFVCTACKHAWEVSYGTGRPHICPSCHSDSIHRSTDSKGIPGKGCTGRRRSCSRKQN